MNVLSESSCVFCKFCYDCKIIEIISPYQAQDIASNLMTTIYGSHLSGIHFWEVANVIW